MTLSRRDFLVAGSALGVTAASPLAIAADTAKAPAKVYYTKAGLTHEFLAPNERSTD